MKKLHVSAYIGHHQVFADLGDLYIWVGGVDEEISVHQVPNTLLLGANKLYVKDLALKPSSNACMKQDVKFQENKRKVPTYVPNQTWLPLKHLKIKIMYHIQNNSVPKSQIPYCCCTTDTNGLMLSTEKPGSVDLEKCRLSEFCMHFRVRGDLKHEIKWRWRQTATTEMFRLKKCYFLNLLSLNLFNCIPIIKGLRGDLQEWRLIVDINEKEKKK